MIILKARLPRGQLLIDIFQQTQNETFDDQFH